MNLDRALIKSQAKEIIKGKVLRLFLFIFVVGIVTGAVLSVSSSISAFQNAGNMDAMMNGDYTAAATNSFGVSIGTGFGSIITLLLAPLEIALCGVFLALIRGTDMELADGLGYIFKNTFDKNYLQKFLMELLRGIFMTLWALLFFIPGIVYYYKTFFAAFIMADNPEMEWKQALDLSKKMTNGHKGELFVLDLSFIPWFLLIGITFGIAGIYVMPYIQTIYALYYENFKQRGLQTGEITEADFVSNTAEMNAAFNQPQYQAPVQPQYQAPVQPAQPTYQPYQAPAQQPTYQAPVQPVYQPPVQEPVQPAYQPPVQEPVQPAPAQPFETPTYQPPQENNFYQPPTE